MKMNARRRKILMASASMLLSATSLKAKASIPDASLTTTKSEVDATLFAAAINFIVRCYVQHDRPIMYSPVARLQREFLLGFSAASELVAALEADKIWQLSVKMDSHIATINHQSPYLRCYMQTDPW